MNENKFLNASPEQVVIFPNPRIIRINHAEAQRAYALFDSKTGAQVSDFISGQNGQVEFKNLASNKHYDVGVIENYNNKEDEKPQFAIDWTVPMRDDTDKILNNSDNLPVEFPCTYLIKDADKNSNVFNLTDENNQTVGQVTKLAPAGDKPKFKQVWSLKMKDDTDK